MLILIDLDCSLECFKRTILDGKAIICQVQESYLRPVKPITAILGFVTHQTVNFNLCNSFYKTEIDSPFTEINIRSWICLYGYVIMDFVSGYGISSR